MSQACCVTARGGNLHQARLPAGRFTTEDVHSNTSIFPPRISCFLSVLRFLLFSMSHDRKWVFLIISASNFIVSL